MANVILDTNILHQEGLSSRNMQVLRRLVEVAHIKLFIPEIVKREFITKRVHDSLSKLQGINNNLGSVSKKLERESVLHAKLLGMQETIRSVESDLEKQIVADFDFWASKFLVKILPFNTESMREVMDDYFTGAGVYRKPKSREDIPDAIINMSINELLDKGGTLTVVIKDGEFRKYLKKKENITVVDSISEFLELRNNRVKLQELDEKSNKIEVIKAYLKGVSFNENLRKFLILSEDDIEYVYIEAPDISSKDKLGVYSFGESINFPQASAIESLQVIRVDPLTESTYSVQVSFITWATINYCVEYRDYLFIDEETDRDVVVDSVNGDGICDLSEGWSLRFFGSIELSLSDHINVDKLTTDDIDLNSSHDIKNIEIDIQSAEILNT